MHRRWVVNRTNSDFVNHLSKAASVSPVIAQVLINRGIKTPEAARSFLRSDISEMADPFALPGMAEAVERIKTALRHGQRVLVHGDYDTDGLTATSIMVSGLRRAGVNASYFIPNRMSHGYGFNRYGVDVAREAGAALIITVDCGISSFDAAEYALSCGIDVIITDHHEPSRLDEAGSLKDEFTLPSVNAIINPKLDCRDARLASLSGAGVAFKLVQAMAFDGGLNITREDTLSYLDLAALGTVADIVSVTDENRIIVKEGICRINSAGRAGLLSLREVCGIQGKETKAGLLAFTVVPRINAAGRIGEAGDVVRLLLAESAEEARDLSLWLNGLNARRQRIEEEVYQAALSKVASRPVGPAIIVSGEGWHEGVLGIVASRLTDQFSRPSFVFTIDNGMAKGSARSIPAFDVCSALSSLKGLLHSFGGHKQAAGVRLASSNLPQFEDAMRTLAEENINKDDMVPALEIDADVRLAEVTPSLVRELAMLEPFGYGNREPVLGAKDLEVISPRIVGKNHLKMKLKRNACAIDAIGFEMGVRFEDMDSPATVDAAFSPVFNDWNGNRSLQLILKGLRPSC